MKPFQINGKWLFPLVLIFCFFSLNLFSQITASGVEDLVNSTTINSQNNPSVSMSGDGNYVVVWESLTSGGSPISEIYFQRYDEFGAKEGVETMVLSNGNNRFNPDVSMNDNGFFVLTFMENDLTGGSTNYDVRYVLYDNDGIPLGSPLRVITSSEYQKFSKVSINEAGNFVVTWQEVDYENDLTSIKKKAYSAGGAAVEPVQTVETTIGSEYVGYPDVALDLNGKYTITWQSAKNDGDGLGIVKRSYDASHLAVTSDVLVNSYLLSNQEDPSIDVNEVGDYIITWTSYSQDGDGGGIYAQRYDLNNTAVGSEFRVSETPTGTQSESSVAVNEGGGFVIAWTDEDADADKSGVYFKVYNNQGDSIAPQQILNTRIIDFQQFPSVAWKNPDFKFVGVWQDGLRNSTSTNDGSDYGVYQQLYEIDRISLGFEIDNFISCNGLGDGAITVNPIGSAGYMYAWSNNDTTQTITGLYAGTYVVTVSDPAGNIAIDSITLEEPALEASSSISMISAGSFYNALTQSCPNDTILMDAPIDYSESSSEDLIIDRSIHFIGFGLAAPSFEIDKPFIIQAGINFSIETLVIEIPFIMNEGELKLNTVEITKPAPGGGTVINEGTLIIINDGDVQIE